MFGCIGRLVSAVVLLIAGALLWHFRAAWMPTVKAWFEQKAEEVQVELPQVGRLVAPGVRFAYVGRVSA